MRLLITDPMWAILEPMIRPVGLGRCGGKSPMSDRMFLEALLYMARTGVPWRDLPGDFGAWDAVYNRFRRWVNNGRLRRLFLAATEHPELGELPRLLIDSTIVRAHQHASGAPRTSRKKGPKRRPNSRASARVAAATAAKSSSSPATRTR